MAITLVFTFGDIINILATQTDQPFNAATNVMCALVVILLGFSCISEGATVSRQLWSFARDRGIPVSVWLAKVTHLPLSTS